MLKKILKYQKNIYDGNLLTIIFIGVGCWTFGLSWIEPKAIMVNIGPIMILINGYFHEH